MGDDDISIINLEYILPLNQKIDINRNKKNKNEKSKNISLRNGLYIFGIIGACIALVSTQTLIPRHNSIIYPSYWLEVNIPVTFHILLSTIGTILDIFIFTKIEFLKSIFVSVKFFSWTWLGWIIPYIICYLIWSIYLGYNHPIPFLGLTMFVSWFVSLIGVWYLFPSDLRYKKDIQKKIKAYIMYMLWGLIFSFQSDGLSMIFENVLSELQWIIAFLIPLFREINYRIFRMLLHKIIRGYDERAHVTMNTTINSTYVLFIAIRLSSANDITVYCILTMEFVLHLTTCFKIIWHQTKKVNAENNDCRINLEIQKLISELVASEVIEIAIALSYIIGFAMAYYGPNGNLQGNVRNDYWAYTKVENVDHVFQTLLLLFTIDVCNFLVSTLLLRTFSSVKLPQEFCKFLKQFWIILAINLATNLNAYFGFNDINLGMDFTLEFDWTTNKGRIRLIQNSSELSMEEKYTLLSNITLN